MTTASTTTTAEATTASATTTAVGALSPTTSVTPVEGAGDSGGDGVAQARAVEDSFERFLLDLQLDLRRTLGVGAAAASTTEDEAEITRSDGVNVAILMALSEALDGRI